LISLAQPILRVPDCRGNSCQQPWWRQGGQQPQHSCRPVASATVLSPGYLERNVQEYFSRTNLTASISIFLGARLSAM